MLQIDYKSGMSICDQLVNGFIRLIAIGVLRTGDSIPSVRQMASQLSVNPNTVQKAYAILEERGVIYSVKGKGSFVADANHTQNAIFERERESIMRAVISAHQVGYQKENILAIIEEIYGKGENDKND